MRWRSEHGRKIIHKHRIGAEWHRISLSVKFRAWRWNVYECRWGQWYRDGETAPAHYHVGRKNPNLHHDGSPRHQNEVH